MILFSRFICGVGFVLLAGSAYLYEPSPWAVYAISLWDGFFSAIGMTALLASIPHLVGRENLLTARALSMLVVRIGSVISPAIAGVIIVAYGVTWNYTLAAIGTLCTLITLVTLPNMKPQKDGPKEHPLRSLFDGFAFVFIHKVIRAVVGLGTLEAMTKSIRILFPVLAATAFGGAAFEVGLMYAAVPIGSILGTLTSGWVRELQRPGVVMLLIAFLSFLCVAAFGLIGHLEMMLFTLVVFGYLVSIGGLLQYTIVQGHTPDHMLGRIGSFWTAQNVVGDSAGALGVGVMVKVLSPALGIISLGLGCAAATLFVGVGIRSLRETNLIDTKLFPMEQEDSSEPPKKNHSLVLPRKKVEIKTVF